MKPIEPGCLAIIIGARFHPENIGRCVTVVSRAYEWDLIHHRPAWRVAGIEQPFAIEDDLSRIDGGDAESDESLAESEREVTA